MAENKTHVAVIFGGRSGEHAVSLMSAKFVLQMLQTAGYAVTPIGITRDGAWYSGDGVLAALEAEELAGLQAVTLLADPTRPGLQALDALDGAAQLRTLAAVDVVFPVLHGTYGEDGTLQGLLELAGVAYVGAGVLGSAAAMDKALFADVMAAHAIPVAQSVLLLRSEIQEDIDAALAKAEAVSAYPLFIKPANLGSSVGISKASSRADLLEALMYAAQYDRRIVVQRGYNVREIEVAVLGNDAPEASLCGEVAPEAEFYSYEAKYHDDRSKTYIPADIPAETSARIRQLAVQAYQACDLAGLARVDFFVDRDSGDVVLNEINTMPGFTSISMYPQLWQASGLDGPALVTRLIELAQQRRAERSATMHEYRRGG
jgi:D-alanine-D-alanine ligase